MDNQIDNFGFNDLNLKEDLLKGVYLYGFTKPSKIQINGIQNISSGKDCMLQSQSGTGKTATYLLGVLNRIDNKENKDNKCQGIIITPTHELADQVYNVAIELSKFLEINIVKCIGGTDLNDNRDKIKTAHLIIGTTGRISHMIKEKRINLFSIKFIVLDEADELLADGFNEKLKFIFDKCSDGIQCCMISATFPQNIFNISKTIMDNPIKILLKNSEVQVDLISQFYVNVEKEDFKFDTLLDLYSLVSTSQAIIFCNSIEKVDWLKENLEKNNFVITCLHGKMNQKERELIINEFRDGKTRILLTTDLLSRGIDIQLVNLVINYDLPINKEIYIHRIGRCGRFNKKGVAITMVKMEDPYDIKLFNKLKHHYKLNIQELPDNIHTYL
jgi:superfamily II DNA/RNA helicase